MSISIPEADRARIAAIDAHNLISLEYSDWELESLSALQGEQAALHERLASHKYPVLTLPNEIVSKFFTHFLPIYPLCPPLTGTLSPTNLTHICRLWREIAAATPELWRAIGFSDKGVCSEHKIYLSNLWLSRSGALPLSIDIDEHWVDIAEILPDFLPHCARWEYLQLQIFSPLPHLPQMPLLCRIDVMLGMTPSIFTLADAPLLRTAIVSARRGVTKGVILPWAQLTSLTLRSVSASNCGPILRQATNLLHCNLRLFTRSDRQYTGPDVVLSHLDCLTMDTTGSNRLPDVLSTFVVPALRSLTIEERLLSPVEPIRSLTAFILKSGCTLQKLHITEKILEDADAYREAFPSTEFSCEFGYLS